MTEPPVVALVASPGSARRAVPLLGVLGRTATVTSWHRRGDRVPDAALVTSAAALATTDLPAGLPVAVWVSNHRDVDAVLARGAAMLLTAKAELTGRGAVLVPPVAIEVDRWATVPPLVRRRRRERLGLPDDLVLRFDGREEASADEADLAVAAAAVVSGPATLLALALGTPIVTSGETAQRLGLRPGRDVETASSPDDALALATRIAGDEAWAASLSRRARSCAEHHLDLGRPAVLVAEGLGLTRAAGPMARIDLRLEELATPAASPIRERASRALAVLRADGGGSST